MWLDHVIRFLRVRKVKKYIPKASVLCDIGCGPDAYMLNIMKSRIKKGIGIDKKIKTRKQNNLQFIKSELQKHIPVPSESVDCICMLAVLEHVQYPELILKQCFRILKKNGYLLITTPSPSAKPVLEFLAYKLKLISEQEINDHKTYFSLSQLKQMIKQAGFYILKANKFEFGFNMFILCKKT